jgi:predicted PurR-regulated permease PerM
MSEPSPSAPAPTPPCEGDGAVVLTPVHLPVGVRSASLALIALCAVLAVLHWAAAVFIPIAMSALMICALSPVVSRLHRHRVPRAVSAAVLLLSLTGSLAGTVYQLSDGASQVVDSLPKAASKVRDKMRERARQPSPIETVQKAAAQIEQAAAETSAPSVARRGVQRVQIERSPLNVRDYLWSGTMGLMSVLGQLTIVLFLSFFALTAGDTFRHKLMRIAGPSLARRKVTLQVIDEINGQVQRYLLVQVVTSAVVGVATGLAYAALGLDNAAVWGVIAGVLNLAPYIGSLIVTGASALVAFLQFGTLDMAFAIGGASLVIHTLVGNLLTPWLTSRASSLSPVAVFVSVLAWGWLWGLWGLLLGIPIMMAVKAVCDRVEDLHAVGELLGN